MTRFANVLLHEQHAIARIRPKWYKVSLSLPFITIVAICNTIKLAILLVILLERDTDPPLVTIGDAISSFMNCPDSNTSAYRNFTLDDFIYMTGDAQLQTKIDVQKTLKGDQTVSGKWQSRKRKYGLRMNQHTALHSNGLTYV